MKAGGILETLLKFQTLFGLQLAYILFGASESLSRGLQARTFHCKKLCQLSILLNLSMKDKELTKLSRVAMIKLFVQLKKEPKLPRYRRAPRLDQGSRPHQFATPMEYFRQPVA